MNFLNLEKNEFLTEIFFVVEFMNFKIFEISKNRSNYIYGEDFHEIWNILCEYKDWPSLLKTRRELQILQLCNNINICPAKKEESIKEIFEEILSLFGFDFNFSRGKGHRINSYELHTEFSIINNQLGCSFSPRDLEGSTSTNGIWHFIEEPIDFISIMQKILLKKGMPEFSVNYHIQFWIKTVFNLKYNSQTKHLMVEICRVINSSFFVPAINEPYSRKKRSQTVGLYYLIDEFQRIFQKSSEKKIALLQSLGIIALLRFCKSQRVRYICLMGKGDSIELNRGLLCFNSVMPIEYNYIVAKGFGSFSHISGINFLFRGGLLPNTEIGKILSVIGTFGSGKSTFALHRLADVAYFGGLSIYFSFEERYEIILNRLNSFNIIDTDRFDIKACDSKNLENELKSFNSQKGLLIFYLFSKNDLIENFEVLLQNISQVCKDKTHKWVWRSLAIDSINALQFKSPLFGKKNLRTDIGKLVNAIQEHNFFGIIVAEANTDIGTTLPYLSDTVIEMSISKAGRWFEIKKARNQNYHYGLHPMRITDGVGINIYPSLVSLLSTFRHKVNTTLSVDHLINLPRFLMAESKIESIAEKSITLLKGDSIIGKYAFLMSLLTTPTESTKKKLPIIKINTDDDQRSYKKFYPVNSILIITFKTPESKHHQRTNNLSAFMSKTYSRWQQIPFKNIRWFSPGADLYPEQTAFEILKIIKRAKRDGRQIERIVFDEFNYADTLLPKFKNNESFWTTLIELISVEAITSFFVSEGEYNQELIKRIESQADYVFNVNKVIEEDCRYFRNIDMIKWAHSKINITQNKARMGYCLHEMTKNSYEKIKKQIKCAFDEEGSYANCTWHKFTKNKEDKIHYKERTKENGLKS